MAGTAVPRVYKRQGQKSCKLGSGWTIVFGSDNVSHVKMNSSKVFLETAVFCIRVSLFSLSVMATWAGSKANKVHNLQVYLCSISL